MTPLRRSSSGSPPPPISTAPSAACVSFRRIIADPSFLRRYHSRHPPLLIGLVSLGLDLVEPSHPNAAAARAFAGAADLSFGFVPRVRGCCCPWFPLDVRDGCVLLRCGCSGLSLTVCDPLSRQCLVLPPISLDRMHRRVPVYVKVMTFLVPSGDCKKKSIRVIAWTHCARQAAVLLFSCASGRWSFDASTTWDALGLKVPREGLSLPCYAYGCFYWRVKSSNKWLRFHINRMEFSTRDYPPGHDARLIVEAGEGRIGVFSHNEQEASLHYLVRQKRARM